MVATFNYMKGAICLHLAHDISEKVQWAKRIARPLYKQNGRPQFAQDFIPQLRGIAAAAERVTKANYAGD